MSALPTRPLGRTGIAVTTLGFGAAPLGATTPGTAPWAGTAADPAAGADSDGSRAAAVAAEAVDAAWAAGIRYFDTAPFYGFGRSERRLGAALRGRPREEYVLSTKVGRTLDDEPDTCHFDFTADAVRRQLESSLERLGLDRVDVVLVHDPDDHVDDALRGAFPALLELRDQGVIRAVGVGMNQWQAPKRFVEETDLDVVLIAGRWTLLDRSARPLLDTCAERGVGVIAAAPFNSGLLAVPRPGPDATYQYAPAPAELIARAGELADEAEAAGLDLPTAALRFPLRHPAVACVLTGMAAPAEVEQNVARLG